MPRPGIDARIEKSIGYFHTTYLIGIPPTITDASACLAFIGMLSAIDALSGFCFAETVPGNGDRFAAFVARYFPPQYRQHRHRLWQLRCRMLDGFSPTGFNLMHHRNEKHLRIATGTGNPILNAEDFYAALAFAAEEFFSEVGNDTNLQANYLARLEHRQ